MRSYSFVLCFLCAHSFHYTFSSVLSINLCSITRSENARLPLRSLTLLILPPKVDNSLPEFSAGSPLGQSFSQVSVTRRVGKGNAPLIAVHFSVFQFDDGSFSNIQTGNLDQLQANQMQQQNANQMNMSNQNISLNNVNMTNNSNNMVQQNQSNQHQNASSQHQQVQSLLLSPHHQSTQNQQTQQHQNQTNHTSQTTCPQTPNTPTSIPEIVFTDFSSASNDLTRGNKPFQFANW